MTLTTGQFNPSANSAVKLYLVDDHLVLRQALAEALEHRGNYQVVGHAGNGAELISQGQGQEQWRTKNALQPAAHLRDYGAIGWH